ncbi:type II toxin-antitoxin system HicB family antitoxin [Sphingomonas sp. 2378]|uniref:type II toxin-antitoxin system HicB family antitoxin n=1 Tax=Sphingomonas sp. 2378 TaxID=1219748 RepID=UPI00311B26CB
MGIAYYPAIIERATKGFGVYFPDVPGCTSFGDTLQQAARNAEVALNGHIKLSAEYGDAIPSPSELDAVARDPDVDEAARVLVRAELPSKQRRINVTMDESLIAAIDKISTNRSGFLAEGARMLLAARG